MTARQRAAATIFLLAALVSQSAAAGLPDTIQKLIDSSPAARTAFWGIQIVDLSTGKTLYELNPDHYFVPASNAKLFSTALALTRLGPDYTFQTRIFADAPPDSQGRISGDLRLVGGGDPNLSARAIPYRMGPTHRQSSCRHRRPRRPARRARHPRVSGDIVGDDTWYVWQPYAVGWAIDDPQSDDGPPISALTLSDNVLAALRAPRRRHRRCRRAHLQPALGVLPHREPRAHRRRRR